MNFMLTSLYIDFDTFISSSDYKSGAWPSGNLRFEQSYNSRHSPMFESCDDPYEFSVQINQLSQDQKFMG